MGPMWWTWLMGVVKSSGLGDTLGSVFLCPGDTHSPVQLLLSKPSQHGQSLSHHYPLLPKKNQTQSPQCIHGTRAVKWSLSAEVGAGSEGTKGQSRCSSLGLPRPACSVPSWGPTNRAAQDDSLQIWIKTAKADFPLLLGAQWAASLNLLI